MTHKKYFGTDGIRGEANSHPMTANIALRVAMATAHILAANNPTDKKRVVIGKDTRLSGYMIEQAMASGFVAMGLDVIRTGPIPTPAIARLVPSLRADIGVMISASHNPYQDNGIKLFGADGYKLSDDIEAHIEAAIEQDLTDHLPAPDLIGKATQMNDAGGRYVEYLKRSFPKGQSLSGFKIVLDCAHGAAYKVAPQTLWELEADVVTIGASPNGRNINDGCGATNTALLQEEVLKEKAHIGIALDGDADRLIVVDEKGQIVDGDQLIGLLALTMQDQNTLQGGVVTTVMSNLGLERKLGEAAIPFLRTQVGDRYVMETMRQRGYNIGGEQSGHIILGHYSTTGDGLLAALQVLSVIQQAGKPVSEVCHIFEPLPQLLKNVQVQDKSAMSNDNIVQALEQAEKALAGQGRVLVRPSGTEPLIRVMAEGDNPTLVEEVVDNLCEVIRTHA